MSYVCAIYNVYELYSGIDNGRVLTVELCTHRNQKLLFLHLFTVLSCKDMSPHFRLRAKLMLPANNSALILISMCTCTIYLSYQQE